MKTNFHRTLPDGRDASSMPNVIKVINSNTNTVLKIPQVQRENMGTYILRAANDEQSDTLNYTLNVLGKIIYNNTFKQ